MSNAMTGPIIEAGKLDGSTDHKLGLPIHVNPDHVVYFNDFLNADDYNTTNFTLTMIDGGGDAAQVVGHVAGSANGILEITTNDADDDSESLQSKQESWRIAAGKKLAFECAIQVDSATTCDLLVGLVITDTTPLTNTDGVYFRVTDGDAEISCVTNKNSTATTTASGVDIVASTDIKLGFVVNGTGSVEFYIDRKKVATHTANICDDENLAITIHLANGSAATSTALVDYIRVVRDR